MAKVVDITEKLSMEGNPRIKVGKQEIEVNSDAASMLQVMGVLSENESTGPREITKMYEIMFAESERKKIEKLKLNFNDFHMLIETAINLVTGEGDEGEQ